MGDLHKTFAILVHTFDGIPLIYSGQEEPLMKRLEFFQKDDIGFSKYEYADFYLKLNKLKHENEALWNMPYGGELIRIGDAEDIYAFKREKNGNKVVVMLNFTNQPRFVTLLEDVNGVQDIYTRNLLDFKKGERVRLEPGAPIVATNNYK